MKKENWVWMPHAGHLIVGNSCRFHLNTYVGKYIVSTVGEYWPDREVRKIMADSRGINIEGRGDNWDHDYMRKIGFEEIGSDRLYETMVFPAGKSEDSCCLWRANGWIELEMNGYREAKEAVLGHQKLCLKWSKK